MVEAGTMTRPILWIFAPAVGRGRRHRRMRRHLARRATRRPSGYVARTARPQRPCAYGRCLMSAPAPRSARRYASRLGAAAARPRAQVRPARTAPCGGRPGTLCASCTRLGSGQPAFAVCPSLRPCTRAAPGRPPQASALAWRGLICARGRAASAPRLRAHTFSLRAGAGALLEAFPYRRRGAAGLARGAHFAYGPPGCPCHSRAASGGRRRPGSGGRARPADRAHAANPSRLRPRHPVLTGAAPDRGRRLTCAQHPRSRAGAKDRLRHVLDASKPPFSPNARPSRAPRAAMPVLRGQRPRRRPCAAARACPGVTGSHIPPSGDTAAALQAPRRRVPIPSGPLYRWQPSWRPHPCLSAFRGHHSRSRRRARVPARSCAHPSHYHRIYRSCAPLCGRRPRSHAHSRVRAQGLLRFGSSLSGR